MCLQVFWRDRRGMYIDHQSNQILNHILVKLAMSEKYLSY